MWLLGGFNGHGLNTTAMGGELVARGIVEDDDAWRLFAPFELVWAGGVLGRAATQVFCWSFNARERVESLLARRREAAALAAKEAAAKEALAKEREWAELSAVAAAATMTAPAVPQAEPVIEPPVPEARTPEPVATDGPAAAPTADAPAKPRKRKRKSKSAAVAESAPSEDLAPSAPGRREG